MKEAEKREAQYDTVPGVGSFLFFFKDNNGIPTW